ncbi:MAG: hypothetical protein HY877_03910, partial [Deltaproteobacteria bacterium]|nr:hypothetical protein [Deltaproteobacteria bacterium]
FADVVPLWRELKQILTAYDIADGVKPLEELIRSWFFSNYERIMSTHMNVLAPFIVVDKPFIPSHYVDESELAGIVVGGERKSLKDFFGDANWLVGDIDEKLWRATNEKLWSVVTRSLSEFKDPDDPKTDATLGTALFASLPAIFPQAFRHLFAISPRLYENVVLMAMGLARGEKEENPTMQMTDRLEKSLEVAFHYFDREVLYHDIFHHYRPWDWSELYLEASYILYQMMSEIPDQYGLSIVGWRDFEGKKFIVSPEERERILKGERTLHVFERGPNTTVTIHLPEKLTSDQFRWISPYNQTNPKVWKTVKTFYEDPAMTVCASIYEEAYAMATRQINPDSTLLQIVNSVVTMGAGEKNRLRADMVMSYRDFIVKKYGGEGIVGLKEIINQFQQDRKLTPMPSAGAAVGEWNQFVDRREVFLASYHYLGYDRQLDEGYEGAYKASVQAGASFDDRRSVLSGWLNFLSESIRLADIVGMLQTEPEWANSYADRYLAVSKELEHLYVEAGRQSDADQLIEDRFSLTRQKMISAISISLVDALEKWSLSKSEVESDAKDRILKRRAETIEKAVPIVSEKGPSSKNEAIYQVMLTDVLGSASGIAWQEWRAGPEFRKVISLNTPRKFEAFYIRVCDRYLALRRMSTYQSENPLMLWLAAIRQIFGETSPVLENVVGSSRVAILARLYQKAQKFDSIEDLLLRDFPDLRVGKLRYNERPPTTSITP